ncbi:MAG: hypothetical protein IPG07_10170 [Crocinitomicaceae bacterium]|nr:hypothetical protein [Crocinitomicaceae bacterium]
MLVHGGKVKGGKVDSHNDHRMAMALAVLGLVSESSLRLMGQTQLQNRIRSF